MSKEAMKLALEALEMWCPMTATYLNTRDKAITALREALAEQPSQTDWEAVAADQAMTIALLKAEQPAQPQQEAWEHHAKKLTHWLYCMSYSDSYFGEPAGLVKQVTGELNRLIGTSQPAQRTWVGLMDEDVRQCSRDVVAGGKENSVDRFAYAIEAKLKEKNNG